jgi:hypothetical protein
MWIETSWVDFAPGPGSIPTRMDASVLSIQPYPDPTFYEELLKTAEKRISTINFDHQSNCNLRHPTRPSMTESNLPLLAMLIFSIASSDSAIMYSTKGGSQKQATQGPKVHIAPSDDQIHNQVFHDKPPMSYGPNVAGQKLLPEVHTGGLHKNEGHLVQRNVNAIQTWSTEFETDHIARKLNLINSKNLSKKVQAMEPANETATGNRLLRDILFTAPNVHFTTITPRIKTSRRAFTVFQTITETTSARQSIKTSESTESTQSTTASEGSVTSGAQETSATEVGSTSEAKQHSSTILAETFIATATTSESGETSPGATQESDQPTSTSGMEEQQHSSSVTDAQRSTSETEEQHSSSVTEAQRSTADTEEQHSSSPAVTEEQRPESPSPIPDSAEASSSSGIDETFAA